MSMMVVVMMMTMVKIIVTVATLTIIHRACMYAWIRCWCRGINSASRFSSCRAQVRFRESGLPSLGTLNSEFYSDVIKLLLHLLQRASWTPTVRAETGKVAYWCIVVGVMVVVYALLFYQNWGILDADVHLGLDGSCGHSSERSMASLIWHFLWQRHSYSHRNRHRENRHRHTKTHKKKTNIEIERITKT